MGISNQIDAIIQKRRSRLPMIECKLNEMQKITKVLSELEYMKNQMIDSDGEIRKDGKYAELLLQNPEMGWKLQRLEFISCRNAIQKATRLLEDCETRFGRDSISISVIGEARRGKSALLKSISGLNDLVIPAFESTDCTGAPSIIYNQTGSRLTAKLTFKSKQQMMQMAQEYLNRLISDESKRIRLRSMEEIRNLNMNDIRARSRIGDVDGIYRIYLGKMIDHYDEWVQYAGVLEPIVLYDEHEIAPFVAQNNGVPVGKSGRVEYYRYLAVDTCEITCSFPQQDAKKINLIDTVGLGDHTIGIPESMLQTVQERSDAVVFMIMPQNGAGSGIPQSVTVIYKQIEESCRDKKLDGWLFYLINHVEKSDNYPANTELCESALNVLRESGFFGTDNARIVNVLDAAAVRDQFLTPLLEKLTDNLDSIDQIYVDQMEESLKAVGIEYHSLCTKVHRVLQSDLSRNAGMIPLINKLTEDSKSQIRSELFKVMNQWLDRRNRPCGAIYNSSVDILERMTQDHRTDSYVPKQSQILEELNTGIQPVTLYTQYLNTIRNAISKDFLNVDVQLKQFVDEMKNDIARVLCQTCGLEILYHWDEEYPLYQWLHDFSRNVLGEDKAYQNIRLAIDTLYEFEFSVKGFLTYEVRNCLDELDPRLSNIPILIGRNTDLIRTAQNIRISLLQRLCDIADNLEKVLRELCIKPNRALFAEVIEFYDRIIYTKGVDMEWTNFFAEKAGVLWSSEIKKIQNVSVMCQEWMDIADSMQQLNNNTKFNIK